jgi:hypothetical protein
MDDKKLEEWMDKLIEGKALLQVELTEITTGTKILHGKKDNSNTHWKSIWLEPDSAQQIVAFKELLTDEFILSNIEFPFRVHGFSDVTFLMV